MDNFSINELELLLDKHGGACGSVSIFMPTVRATEGMAQNEPRLKHLMGQAEDKLVKMGVRPPETKKYLQPIKKLPQNPELWQHLQDGLAIFLAPELFRYYTLPVSFAELVVVADRFHTKPLISLLSGDTRFFVLVLSQKGVKLLKCTENNFEEIKLGNTPVSLAEALQYDQMERVDRYHTGAPGVGKEGMVSHGQDFGDIAKSNILRFFQLLEKGIQPVLAQETAPLILAGVDYLHPIYRQANSYRYLIQEGIAGNPDLLSDAEVHKKAYAIVKPHLLTARKAALDEYGQLVGKGHTSKAIEEIVQNAYAGQVETLFVAGEKQIWGNFDPAANKVALHQAAESCDDDLLDFAAAHTLLHKGNVYVMKTEEMPEKSPATAIFRHETHARSLSHKPIELRASEFK